MFYVLSSHLHVSFARLYGIIPSLPPDLEPATWAGIDDLINMAPEGQCLSLAKMRPYFHFLDCGFLISMDKKVLSCVHNSYLNVFYISI